jgi:hypothetical protein
VRQYRKARGPDQRGVKRSGAKLGIFVAFSILGLRRRGPVDNLPPMSTPADPRQLAKLCRRLANVPTSGGHRADRVLHALAEKLDQEAALAERLAAEPQDRDRR